MDEADASENVHGKTPVKKHAEDFVLAQHCGFTCSPTSISLSDCTLHRICGAHMI
jgi:hypothetical protein